MLRRAWAAVSPPCLRVRDVNLARTCSKTGCVRPAVATLTFAYADRAAVLGPLATYAEPHTYDLCSEHTVRLTAPRGWDVVRLVEDLAPASATNRPVPSDDLFDLADAIRERGPAAAAPAVAAPVARASGETGETGEIGRRGHLRVLRGLGES